MPNKKSPATKIRSRRVVDPQTNKRIHEHLTNKNDQVSEEDIRNVRTDVIENNNLPEPEENISNKRDQPEEDSINDNTDPEIQTSWNALEE